MPQGFGVLCPWSALVLALVDAANNTVHGATGLRVSLEPLVH